MKLLLLVFLIGCAAAVPVYNHLENEAELERILQAKDDMDTEIGTSLKEQLERFIEKLKEYLNKGKEIKEEIVNEFLDKIKEIKEKLKEKNVEISEKAKEMIEKLKESFKNHLENIAEKIKNKIKNFFDKFLNKGEKKSVQHFPVEKLKDILIKIKELLLNNFDKEKLKAKIQELFPEGSLIAKALIKIIDKHHDNFKQLLLNIINGFLDKGTQKRSLKELYENVRDYFQDLKMTLKEKFFKFGEFVQNKLKIVIDNSKSKIDNLKEIARELIKHAKYLTKDVAEQAKEFLNPYKDHFKDLYNQLVEIAKDLKN